MLWYSITSSVWTIVSLVLGIVGGLAVYFMFLKKENENKFEGFLGWLYNFLNFKKLSIETILKVTYLMIAIFITLASLSSISESFISFLVILIIGNFIVRVIYEFLLLQIMLYRNTTEINNKLTKKDE